MADISIEQAIYGNTDSGGFRFLARSPGFLDTWLPNAERICAGFGDRPAGIACPLAVFAQPFGPKRVVIVQVADQGSDDAGRPGALAFRLLVVPREAYERFLGDPFEVADLFPPPWQERGSLPVLTCGGLPPRKVEQLQKALQGGPSPTLLGSAQALIDSGHVVFERSEPAPDLIRRLWLLLPQNTRAQLWPASFAFGNTLGFDAVVVPRADPQQFPEYVTEEQAGDYPEGRYELALQMAVESGNQEEMYRLLSRRSSRQTIKLAILLLVVVGFLAIVTNIMNPPDGRPPATLKGSPVSSQLRLPDDVPPLTQDQREKLTKALGGLAEKIGVKPLPEAPTPEMLLKAIDQRLGTPDPQRDPGPLEKLGHPERQLRALLWKHNVPRYNDHALNPLELVERLQDKVTAAKPS